MVASLASPPLLIGLFVLLVAVRLCLQFRSILSTQPGVSIIALEAMRTHKLAVPIVPVGMQYFEGDKYRGRYE